MSHWTLDDGRVIRLLTPRELLRVPDGTVLTSILGERMVKGTDPIDDDTRGGYLAFGIEAQATTEPSIGADRQ